MEFELDQARSKNNIAENSVALGYDTHSTFLSYNSATMFKIQDLRSFTKYM